MDNTEHDDNSSDLEVEITDLDPIDTDSKFAAIRIIAYTLLTKRPWQQVRFLNTTCITSMSVAPHTTYFRYSA